MKTLLFCNLAPRKLGAVEWLAVSLGREFRASGDRLVAVFAEPPHTEVADHLKEAGVAWDVIDGWIDARGREHPWRFPLRALRIVLREKPDAVAVHFGNELPSLAVSLMARVCGMRRTRWVWIQDQQIQGPSPLTGRLSKIRLLNMAFHRFVAVYEGGRTSLVLRRIPENRIRVIPNAIRDHRATRPKGWLRAELAVPAEAVVAAVAASLIPRKRVAFALDAFAAAAPQAAASAHLVVIGEGPERERLTAWVRQRGIESRVHFLGFRKDLRDILSESDMLVHAATAEGCAYVILESMAAGIPAVVTDAGAAREQIEHGTTGYILARDDLSGFVGSVARLIDDHDLRKQMGTAARLRWEKHFRVEAGAREYHELYRQLTVAI
jgi:glycosyltransferase involved in cell wall biosynthesis